MSNRAISTTGDARELIVECMVALKNGTLDVSRGMAVIEGMDVLNKSIQAEVNAAKMSLLAAAAGKDFGDVVRLGKRKIFSGELIRESDDD
jgi:hypothetical protein